MIPSPRARDLTSATPLDERSAIATKNEHQTAVKCSKILVRSIPAQQHWP